MRYDLPDSIQVRADGPVRIVEFSRPDRLNGVDQAVHAGLARIWRQLERDEGARAVVLTGAGRAFSAGGDPNWIAGLMDDPDQRRIDMQDGADILREMVRFRLPVVAAVNGPAVGLGCSVAVSCDIVVMADDTYLMDPHVSIGLVAGDGGAAMWPWLTSMLAAKEYLLLGDRIPADEARRLGLANRVVPRDHVFDESLRLAHRLAAQPARALQDTKRSLHMHLTHAVGAVLEFALATESECFSDQEFRERITAMRRGTDGH